MKPKNKRAVDVYYQVRDLPADLAIEAISEQTGMTWRTADTVYRQIAAIIDGKFPTSVTCRATPVIKSLYQDVSGLDIQVKIAEQFSIQLTTARAIVNVVVPLLRYLNGEIKHKERARGLFQQHREKHVYLDKCVEAGIVKSTADCYFRLFSKGK